MRFTKLLWLAAISTALCASPAHATKRPRYGGTLRVELSATSVSLDPRTWRPGSVAGAANEKLAALVYDRLVTLDDYGRFQPALATEWSHDAASRTWQFKLRPGVKFSDNELLAPKDVATALQALLPPGLQVTAIDSSLQIHAPHPVPDLLEQLASGRYFIFRVLPDTSLAGTGPFVLEGALPSQPEGSPLKPLRLKFRAREDAWSGRPFLDTIDVALGNLPLRQILDLQVGRADIIDIPPDLVRKARQDNLRVWSSPPETLLALRLDDSQPASANPQFREALDLALDRDTMANVLLQRQALPTDALLPQWLSGYAFLFGNPMNVDRAKTLQASLHAGAPAVEPVRLRVDAVSDLMKLLGERVAINARQANIGIQIAPHAGTSSNTSSAIGLHLFAWHYSSLSPRAELQALAQHLHSESGTESEAIEESANPEKLYAQERRLLDERQILPLLLLPEYVGIAPNVRNWSPEPSGSWRLADVWIEPAVTPASSPDTASDGNSAPGVRP
jgi:peptide/nickel transport system substrate-binding protein